MIKATLLQKPELTRLAFPGPAGIGLGKPFFGEASAQVWDWASITAGVWRDERLLSAMLESDDALGSSAQKLAASACHAGWKLRSERNTPAAAIAKGLIQGMFRSVRNMSGLILTVAERACLGWSPVQFAFEYRAGSYYPKFGVVQPAEQYWIDQSSRIVHFGGPALEPVVWDGIAARAWVIVRFGATGEAYGWTPLHRLFPLYYIRQSILTETASAPVRLGPMAQVRIDCVETNPARRRALITEALREVARTIKEHGLHANVNGNMEIELVSAQSSGMPDALQVVQMIGDMMRFQLTGEAASGSKESNLATGRVGQQQLHQGAYRVAAMLEEFLGQCAENFAAINGWQIDPEDMPSPLMRAFNRPDLQAVGVLSAGGARIDAAELADDYRVVLDPGSPTFITGQVPATAPPVASAGSDSGAGGVTA